MGFKTDELCFKSLWIRRSCYHTKRKLKLGRVTVQRKGGDGGRKTANMLQFKVNPTELFDNI